MNFFTTFWALNKKIFKINKSTYLVVNTIHLNQHFPSNKKIDNFRPMKNPFQTLKSIQNSNNRFLSTRVRQICIKRKSKGKKIKLKIVNNVKLENNIKRQNITLVNCFEIKSMHWFDNTLTKHLKQIIFQLYWGITDK